MGEVSSDNEIKKAKSKTRDKHLPDKTQQKYQDAIHKHTDMTHIGQKPATGTHVDLDGLSSFHLSQLRDLN